MSLVNLLKKIINNSRRKIFEKKKENSKNHCIYFSFPIQDIYFIYFIHLQWIFGIHNIANKKNSHENVQYQSGKWLLFLFLLIGLSECVKSELKKRAESIASA